ncbi:GH32 C-terminal domain-containing protein, partial [Mycobacterium ulcerans]
VPLVVKKGGILKLHLLVDRSSVEVFINDGEKTLTNIIFPNESSEGIEMKAVGDVCQIYSLAFYPLKSIWAGMGSR